MNEFVSLYKLDQEAAREWRGRLIRFWMKYAFFITKLVITSPW